jgi:PPOX class probable F420-dependent enzyme
MASGVLSNPNTAFERRVRRRLREEQVIWLTTVGADGTPQPNPVWFWWEDDEVIVYNRPDAHRISHVRSRPQVALHFDGNGRGGDIVVLRGTAHVDDQVPPAYQHSGYATKYRSGMVRVSGGGEQFSEDYSVRFRIQVTGVRGH